ncbi:MAG: tetratricopeptide repeat protein [Planctomycetota bacterium]|nr:tetratricopeptide repeat protein [Planctomycetota bacterium]
MISDRFGEDPASVGGFPWLHGQAPEPVSSHLGRLQQLSIQLAGDPRFPSATLISPEIEGSADFFEDGMTLDRCIARTCPDPERNWEVLVPGGLRTLVGHFSNLARLLAVLNEEGFPVLALTPQAVVLGHNGGLLLRADLLFPDLVENIDEFASRIAPEILLSTRVPPLDECQIVYALAALIHECALGRPPWAGRGATEVADRILSGIAIVDRIDVVTDPPGLLGLLRDSLSLDPQRRPASLRGFASMLEAVRDGARPRAQRRSSTGESVKKERRWQLIGGVIALLLFAGFIGRLTVSEPILEDLVADLSTAMLVRPLPVHAEDLPLDPLGKTLLELHGESARDLHGAMKVQRELAWVSLRAGQFKEARQAARFAVQSDPSRPGPWVILGIAALEQGDGSGLLELERGLKLPPVDLFDYWSVAAGQFYLLRFVEAIATLDEIIEKTPKDADVWFHHALALLRSGDHLGASSSLARSRQIRPLDGWIDWLSAEIALTEGREAEVRRILEEATARFSASKALALRAGSLWDRLGDTPRSREWIRRADSDRLDSPHREWRHGGRIVEEGRAHLLLGPPFPPK